MHHGQPSAGFTTPCQAVRHDQFSKIPARSTGANAADQLASLHSLNISSPASTIYYVANNDSLAAIRSWWRLERARAAFDAEMKRELGISGSQLALLRIIAEYSPVSIRQLRAELDWHPASLGQALQRLEARGLVELASDTTDRRRRICSLTQPGKQLLASTPEVGPVRLRSQPVDPNDLVTMRRGFELALKAFGLEQWGRI